MKLSLVLLVACLWVGLVTSYEEDNEFADFELEDDEVIEKENPTPQADVNRNPAVKEAKTSESFNDDDDSDGIVEDEFDNFDKDEFEGFGGSDSDLPDPKAGEPKLTIAKVPLHFRKWDSYWIEILFIVGLVVYFLNYAMGKSKNIKIAEAFLSAHKTFLEENFAMVGDDGKKETDISETGLMIKESDSVFTLFCSGRVCIEGMLVELKLIKRQDLFSLAMGILGTKVQDQIVIKAELEMMDTFVFAVCSKKSATKLMKDMSDLVSKRCKFHNFTGLKSTF